MSTFVAFIDDYVHGNTVDKIWTDIFTEISSINSGMKCGLKSMRMSVSCR